MIRNEARVAVLAMVAGMIGAIIGGGVILGSNPSAALLGVGAAEALPARTGIFPVNFTFYGSAAGGWGFNASPLSNPGPTIKVFRGDIVNLTLISTDDPSVKHTWFIDYNSNNLADGGEPSSPDFTSAQARVWNFTADLSGSWVYKCGYHQMSMTGNILIIGGVSPMLPRGTIPLITSIMVGALAFVLVFAAVYHVRAVRAAKRAR